jgi:16S rRNA (guanine966-N2)-methyltransferase
MRIVGGRWRGRTLKAPKGDVTRPTSDRVREALFDALAARLGSDLGGGAVLDLYAGTGALGLEALSRGCSRAVFVEDARAALDVLRANVASVGAGECTAVVAADARNAGLARASSLGPYALLLIDPPYRIDAASVADALARLVHAGSIQEDAIVAYEHPSAAHMPDFEGFAAVRTYVYGETAVTLLSLIDTEAT